MVKAKTTKMVLALVLIPMALFALKEWVEFGDAGYPEGTPPPTDSSGT